MRIAQVTFGIPLDYPDTEEEMRETTSAFLSLAGGLFKVMADNDSPASAGVLGANLLAVYAASLEEESYKDFMDNLRESIEGMAGVLRTAFNEFEGSAEEMATAEMEALLAKARGQVQ